MSKTLKKPLCSSVFVFASLLAALALATPAAAAARKGAIGEVRNEFFMVSEANLQKHRLVLELPSQSTMVMHVDAKTEFTNRQGRRMPLADIRAGDTVYVTYVKTAKSPLALKIRSGPMTVKILHERYWNG